MVAKTITLPNIRELFVPDPDYTFWNVDLKQADAQVVAWEADDEILKAIFRDPTRDLHDENCKDIFGILNKQNRHYAKQGVHATNYGVKANKLAKTLNITVHAADRFIKRWFMLHPKIKKWHERVEMELQTRRTIYNKFGNRRVYFGRVEELLPQALAWVPQSTVALVINRGLINLYKNLRDKIKLLLQVHDSLNFQSLTIYVQELKPLVKKNLEIIIPYSDPLIIPVELSLSTSSWGECVKTPW